MARSAAAAMLAAIEIYNKPTVEYREQTFAILATNAWEVLLKARVVQQSGGKINSIILKDKGRYVQNKETGRPMTISWRQALGKVSAPDQVAANIRGLVEIRNECTHLGLLGSDLRRTILSFGTASVQNFVALSKDWFGESVEVSYLLPIGFVGNAALLTGIHSRTQRELIKTLDQIAHSVSGNSGSAYSTVMSVEINLSRNLSGGGSIGITDDPNAPRVSVSDDEALALYPASYAEVVATCRERFQSFKKGKAFNLAMRVVKENPECAHERRLDPNNPKSPKKTFYNLEKTLDVLDREYGGTK